MTPAAAYARLDDLAGLLSAERLRDFLRDWDPTLTPEELETALLGAEVYALHMDPALVELA